MSPPADSNSPRIVVPVLAGIGNAVMTVPLVRALARLPGGARITVAARTAAMADCFNGLDELAACVVLGSKPAAAWRAHRRLAADLRPDVCVVPFPSNRWQYALLAATSGARRIVMHDYPVGRRRALRFLPAMLKQARFVPAERGLHDVPQNLRLASELGADLDTLLEVERPIFVLADTDRAAADGRLEGARGFIALQPGCGDTRIGREKRWPAESFARLADALAAGGHEVIVIEGPDERGVGRQVGALAGARPRVLELSGTLKLAAAVLERAALYVGNDSGLAHVAAAVGTPPVTLFAAADPSRVAPFGYRELVVIPPAVNGRAWAPRLMYPMDHPGPRLRDAGGIDWARHIRLEDVLTAVGRALAHSAALPRDAGVACAGFTRLGEATPASRGDAADGRTVTGA